MREISAAFILLGGFMTSVQRAVDPVADPDLVLERLNVNVAGAPLHRVGEDAVDQLDHRRVVDLGLDRGFLVLLLQHLDVVGQPLHVLEDGLELHVGGS